MKNLQVGIGNDAIKCVRGTQSCALPSPEKQAFQQNHIRLTAARRDDVSFQVFVQAGEDFILAVTDNAIFHPRIELPILRMQVAAPRDSGVTIDTRIEGFLEDDDRCLKADMLLSDESILVTQNECQPVWVDVKIPADCRVAQFGGEVAFFCHRLFEDEQCIGRLGFTVDVIDVLMPQPRDFHFYLDLWLHPTNIARTHGVTLWSDEHFALLEGYWKSMAELGQKVITVVVSEVPWAGQYCFDVKPHLSNLFEYSIIPVVKDEAGKLVLDFSKLDRYVQTCLALGIDKEIEVIGLVNAWCREGSGFEPFIPDYPDALRIRYFDRKEGTYKYCREGKDISEYMRQLEAHMKAMGWLDIVRIMADEPADTDRYRLSVNAIRRAAPELKFKAAINHTSFIQSFQNEIDDYVMLVGCMLQEWPEFSAMKAAGKGRYLWYTCCGNTPDNCLRAPLLETRFIGWLTAYLSLEGFLRWNYTVWPENPTKQIYWNAPLFPAGENNFVYPGGNGAPILSTRYMHLRRGIRDFELIRLVRENCESAEELLKGIFQTILLTNGGTALGTEHAELVNNLSSHINRTCEDYESAKKTMLEALEACKMPDVK
jgi:hypothetical protein